MAPQAPWSPTAHTFALHQFSQVANFWKQGRHASFQLEALPGGRAELNLTFQLPTVSEVIPPPSHVSPAPPERPIHPLFPNGSHGAHFPQESGLDPNFKPATTKVSSRLRKNYWRSVLHKAASAASSLPHPKIGSLRQAAQACVQRMQVDSTLQVSTPTARKRVLSSSPSVLSPSNSSPLAQRIRQDLQISGSDGESPEREQLRSQQFPEKFPSPSVSPCAGKLPPPAPLIFTPAKEPDTTSCKNCNAVMTPDHQCEVGVSEKRKTMEVVLSTSLPVSSTSEPDPTATLKGTAARQKLPPPSPIPLPLCHYCCHKGSGQNPVHYHEQCLCAEKVCSCYCYCTEEQLMHKLQFFPSGSSVIGCVPAKDRPMAKELAEKRIGRWPIFPCTGEDCAKPVIR